MNRTHDETSEALVTAAHGLLAESGPEALTVRRIANAAGMSTMNVYSRFGGKDGVVDELYADGYRRLYAALDAVPSTADVPGDLERVASTFRDWALQNPPYYGIMFRSTIHGFEPSQESVDFALGGLQSLVDRIALGQQRGDILKPEGCDPREIAAWLWATCHGMISLELDGVGAEFITWESVFRNGVRTAVHGLHPSVAPAPIPH